MLLIVMTALALVGRILPQAQGAIDDPVAQPAVVKGYVGLFTDNAIAVFDVTTNRVLNTISVPPGPHGLVASPDGNRVYVSSEGAVTVSVIDTAADAVIKSIDVGRSPHGLALTPDGKYLLVAVNGADQLMKIDIGANKVTGMLSIPMPESVAVSPDGSKAYVASQLPDKYGLVVVALPRLSQLGFVPLRQRPRGLAFSPDGRQLAYTLADMDAVRILDPSDNSITGSVIVGSAPLQPAFLRKGGMALATVQGARELALVDTVKNALVASIQVGTAPHMTAVMADDRTAYVTNEGTGTVSVVNLADKNVTTSFPVGGAPRDVVIVVRRPEMKVDISNFAFTPAALTIAPGQTVVWTNKDAAPHTITSDNGAWSSGKLQQGDTFRQSFIVPGAYAYHCQVHPMMKGSVTVKD